MLHLAQRTNRCTVLGPGTRAVLWVQGCMLRCPGCIAPETLPFKGGIEVRVDVLAEEIIALSNIEGITFSGGEPMAQAAALCALVDRIRAHSDLSFLSYTGLTIEDIFVTGTSAQREFLKRLDILIDGPYVRERHTDLRWRGSDNQRVHFLTNRYRYLTSQVNDRGFGIEFEMPADGSIRWMGIPPVGFKAAVLNGLQALGIDLIKGDKK